MQKVLKLGKNNVTKAQKAIRTQANKYRQSVNIKIGDKIILNGKNLNTERLCKKLNNIRYRLYKIIKNLKTLY